MFNIILAYIRGNMVKFKVLNWNGYTVRLLHHKNNIRRALSLIPYFWDDEVHFSLVIRQPKVTSRSQDVWEYKWKLLDLEGNRLKEGGDKIDIIYTQGLSKYFWDWTAGKSRAIVLGNLSPNKNYILKVKFTDEMGGSIEEVMATFSTKDRTEFYMQIFLILFSVVAALFFSVMLRGCGL